jgi:class 3 adenylate cyclase/tetratricopeptide (TPR) repeat protein
MQQITDWLEKLGMSEYAQRFAENDIDVEVLGELTDKDFDWLGVSIGHRRKMMRAIREFAASPVSAVMQRPASATTDTQAAARDTAERRQVTVMFSDLVGSTALSARMDPEDLRDIISAYQKCVAETVQRFGGFVAKFMGDGVLVYFGYPQAHEHDAERAVRAGLELIADVNALKAGAPLQTRVGIATGLVVVGDLIGAGEAQERGIVGETPNLAARLQGIAEPNTVVIAGSTRKLLGNLFELEDLGPKDLKGIAGQAHAWAAVRPSSVESRFEALRTATTPLVGRDEEMELLMRRWAQAKAGDGCVVLISGEPGIGKSRIAEAMQERLGAEPHTRLRFFCSSYHQDSALYPTIAQLERAAGFRREDTADQRLAKLEAVLAQATNDLSEVVPLLTDLLSISTGDRYPPLNLTPQKRKEKTLHAQIAQVKGLAARQAVLMVWEDVHWSDPTTRESLDLLIDRLPRLRVLMILTFRPEFTPPWIGRPHVTMLTLNRLPRRHGAEMIAYVTGGKALPKEIAEQIIDRTDGVPLFIEELTKTLVESGIVTEAGDHYAAVGPAVPLAIPTSLHASLLARLDRLAPTREVAQIAAALGRSFSHELISAVAQISRQKLDDALEQLVHAELIFRRGTPPHAEYTFKHALVQDAAYSTLLRSRRHQLHGHITAILEAHFPEIVQTQPEVLARHSAEAALPDKAVGYCLKAGQQAMARWAMTEAVAQLRRGLEFLSGIPDETLRNERELDLQIMLGQALVATKGYGADEPAQTYARARELCQQLNRPAQLGQVLWGHWVFCHVRAELEQAEEYSGAMRQLGDAQNDPMWKCFASAYSADTCSYLGKFIEARAYSEKALSLWNASYRAFVPIAGDPYVVSLISLSQALLWLGYIDQARLRRNEVLSEARNLSPYTVAFATTATWVVDWAAEGVHSAARVLASADEALAISAEQGYPLWMAFANAMRGWSLAALGQPTEGLRALQDGIDATRATGAGLWRSFFLTLLADAYAIVGQPRAGLKPLAEAAELIGTTQERWAEAETHRLRGRLMQSLGDDAASEDCYRHALDVARRQSAKLWELRAAMSMARLWRDQGKRDEARKLLAPVYGWFTEGFDTRDLKEAKALLEELAT